MIVREEPVNRVPPVFIHRLTFDYDNRAIAAQKEKKIPFVRYCNDMELNHNVLMTQSIDVRNGKLFVDVYRPKNLLSNAQPESVSKDRFVCQHYITPCLFGNRCFYFNDTVFAHYYSFSRLLKVFGKLCYYDFDTKLDGQIELNGMPEYITMERAVLERSNSSKNCYYVWHGHHLYYLFTVQDLHGVFNNALVVLEFEKRIWRPIELTNKMRYTANPLMMDENDGVLIFLNAQVPNPRGMEVNGDHTTFSRASNSNKMEASFVYRMPICSPEKLIQLTRMTVAKRSPKVLEKLNFH